MKLSFEFEPWELKLLGNLAKLDLMEDDEDDDDAEDEQRCCDDEPAKAEKADAVDETFENLFKAIRDAHSTGDCKCHRRDANRSDD